MQFCWDFQFYPLYIFRQFLSNNLIPVLATGPTVLIHCVIETLLFGFEVISSIYKWKSSWPINRILLKELAMTWSMVNRFNFVTFSILISNSFTKSRAYKYIINFYFIGLAVERFPIDEQRIERSLNDLNAFPNPQLLREEAKRQKIRKINNAAKKSMGLK